MKSDFRASQTGEMDSSLWRVIRRNLASRPMLMGYAFFFCRSFGKFGHQPTQSLCLLWPTTNWESLLKAPHSWLPSRFSSADLAHLYFYLYFIWFVVYLPLLKNMSSSMGRIIPYIMENKKCSKPPTSHDISMFLQRFLPGNPAERRPRRDLGPASFVQEAILDHLRMKMGENHL